MNGREYIISKQLAWASSKGLRLIGSKKERGAKVYAETLEDNLFMPLSSSARKNFSEGDGKETEPDRDGNPAKMQALHSSSALAVNVFQYWQSINMIPAIAAACGFCEKSNHNSVNLCFEKKFVISPSFQRSPNIDVVIENKENSRFSVFAIESKFSEAYSPHKHDGLKEAYLALSDLWDDIPKLKDFAATISPLDNFYKHLHPAQLIKHILGLKKEYGKKGFRLLYLWYDCFGNEGAKHREEIKSFNWIAKSDGIHFHAITYQKLIADLWKNHREEHPRYVYYLTSRYL
jgi:hypothetical protein